MSHYDYEASRRIEAEGFPFYALVMALYRQADGPNRERIAACWPDTAAEMKARYNRAGGLLPGEPGYDDLQERRQTLGLPPT